MRKVSNRVSTSFSLILAYAVLVMLMFFGVALPFLMDYSPIMLEIKGYFAEHNGETVFWCWIYALLVSGIVCCGALVMLLTRVRKGLVFSEKTVSIIRFLSYGCFFIAAICLAVVYYLHSAYLLTVAAGFLGLCLRVVKNVLSEATVIKTENDYTV